jgi:S1-C subfamily serine protease
MVIAALAGCSSSGRSADTRGITATEASQFAQVVVRIDVKGSNFSASGSGTLIDKRGYVLTCDNVVENATTINVTTYDNQSYSATVQKSDRTLDLALLKLDSKQTDFPVATLGANSDIVIGGVVLAIGFRYENGVPSASPVTTQGTVSSLSYVDGITFIRNSAVTSPGSGCGCLITSSGKMVGIPSAVDESATATEEANLAIPIDYARTFLQGML